MPGISPAIEQLAQALARAIGTVVREERRAQNLRQAELSEIIGIARPTASRIEGGRECPTLPMFVLLAYGVQVPPAVLLERAVNLPDVQAALLQSLQRGAAGRRPKRR
ncbi:MAG: helix-turn-helix domain-containing protein [Steroidobacteraceae bacterium]